MAVEIGSEDKEYVHRYLSLCKRMVLVNTIRSLERLFVSLEG